jgi:sulfate transport system permease protein
VADAAPAVRRVHRRSVLPGFGLAMGFTMAYLSLLVLIPLATLFLKAQSLSWDQFVAAAFSKRALAAYWLSFTASLWAAAINVVIGVLIAWVLVRYRFFGRTLMDALVDLPFALPTAVSGIALTALYGPTGWLGEPLGALGLKISFTRVGIVLALVFVSFPFVVRTVQPVLAELSSDMEEASATLGASRLQTLVGVVLPNLVPAMVTGFALAFARSLGEYGSIVFISGNMPMKTEIVPLLIMTKLEQYDYGGATALAAVMLTFSFALLLAINALQAWSRRRYGAGVA